MRKENIDRAERAEIALKAYSALPGDDWKASSPREHLSDLLSDLMHYADFRKVNFSERLDFAEGCYKQEKKTGHAI